MYDVFGKSHIVTSIEQRSGLSLVIFLKGKVQLALQYRSLRAAELTTELELDTEKCNPRGEGVSQFVPCVRVYACVCVRVCVSVPFFTLTPFWRCREILVFGDSCGSSTSLGRQPRLRNTSISVILAGPLQV